MATLNGHVVLVKVFLIGTTPVRKLETTQKASYLYNVEFYKKSSSVFVEKCSRRVEVGDREEKKMIFTTTNSLFLKMKL